MSHRTLTAFMVALACLDPVPASGQAQIHDTPDTSVTWSPPRTPGGQPDLQGYWSTQTFTPIERPAHLTGKEFFTEEEQPRSNDSSPLKESTHRPARFSISKRQRK